MNSLRHKIVLGYSVIGALVIALSVFSFLELRLIERKIAAGGRVAELFDASLEIRRFEKNYFLYRQPADLAENRAWIGRAHELLRSDREQLAALVEPTRLAALHGELERYGELMETYAHRAGSDPLAADIRKSGKEIVTVAEELAGSERRALQALLDRHRRLLLGSVAGVIVLVALIGHLMARRVARPLRQMERNMEAVAAGRLKKLDMAAQDSEIASLTQAFNHVLDELETRQGQLVRSEKLAALGTLLSGVAHELNNPLSNIGTSCQILAEEGDAGDPAFRREILGQIDGETWRARRIVRSLLDYARDRQFTREALPLAALVDETLRLIRGQIPARVALAVDIPADLTLSGDKQRLQQALLNLVRNAVEAVEGAGEVRIAARAVAGACSCPPDRLIFGQCGKHGSMAELEIRDDGHGIAPEVLPRIFDPFFTTKEVGHGLGLGLFVVFEIVEEHGGCIAVESTLGKGTAFFLRLPLEKV